MLPVKHIYWDLKSNTFNFYYNDYIFSEKNRTKINIIKRKFTSQSYQYLDLSTTWLFFHWQNKLIQLSGWVRKGKRVTLYSPTKSQFGPSVNTFFSFSNTKGLQGLANHMIELTHNKLMIVNAQFAVTQLNLSFPVFFRHVDLKYLASHLVQEK